MSEQFMLMFSLGPVQPFIAQARKTRDLWLGSMLIAKLMEAGLQAIDEKALVYPTNKTVKMIPDIPNKYIALYTSDKDAKKAANDSVEQMKVFWEGVKEKVWNDIIRNVADGKTEDIWRRQTDFSTLFEVFWVIQARQDMKYNVWLKRTEEVFAARKQLRDFPGQNEPGEKSSISGIREVLCNEAGVSSFWEQIANKQSANDIDPQGNEHLDAVDTIKRFAMVAIQEKKPFPSTSSVATTPFIENLLTASIDEIALGLWCKTVFIENLTRKSPQSARNIPYLHTLTTKLGKENRSWLLRLDGDLYFPETFAPRRLEKDYKVPEEKVAQTISQGKSALASLLKATDARNITRPTPYYSILVMDGDNIGMLLNDVTNEDQHKKVSQALSDFSRIDAPSLVEEQYPGRLVYSGGDDVLAMAPLAQNIQVQQDQQNKTVLHLVDLLQQYYQRRVTDALQKFAPDDIARITASTGIAITHHYTSLAYALRTARDAESTAKKRYGKNSLVVTVVRRSGEQTRVGCKWRYANLPDDAQPILLFTRFYELFLQDVLSPKCIHVLLEEASILVGLERSAQQSEVKRVLLRQLSEKYRTEAYKAEMKLRAEQLVLLAAQMDEVNTQAKAVALNIDQVRYGLVETLGWLLVMAFLARKDQE